MKSTFRFIFDYVREVETENIDIRKSTNRIVSQTISSKVALPPFPASIKDGYAVRSADGAGVRKLFTSIAAGDDKRGVFLPTGYVARINTGAPVPKGADAVVQVEDTRGRFHFETSFLVILNSGRFILLALL